MAKNKDEEDGLPEVNLDRSTSSIQERFSLDNPSELFEFIQKVAFPKMPLEMVAILVTRGDVALVNRLANQIWIRMEAEIKYPHFNSTRKEYVSLLKEYLRFSTSYKGIAREQLFDTAIAGLPREKERIGWRKGKL